MARAFHRRIECRIQTNILEVINFLKLLPGLKIFIMGKFQTERRKLIDMSN